jgi:hypothetical protein
MRTAFEQKIARFKQKKQIGVNRRIAEMRIAGVLTLALFETMPRMSRQRTRPAMFPASRL